ncbi:MAG: hypothetical protein Q9227_003586 [Pyrenula ochraceoflavens]
MRAQRFASALDRQWIQVSCQLPPSFLAPRWAHLHTDPHASQFRNTGPEIPPLSPKAEDLSSKVTLPPDSTRNVPQKYLKSETTKASGFASSVSPYTSSPMIPRRGLPPLPAAPSPALKERPLVLTQSLATLLPHLRSQPPFYVRAHVHRFPFILTEGDTLRLPFHLHGVSPGDVLRLNRVTVLGSRDFTIKPGWENVVPDAHSEYESTRTKKATRYIDERLFECRARVIGTDSGPMLIKEKTKRRQRRTKTVKSKHKHTVLKVMEIKVKPLEQLGNYILEPQNAPNDLGTAGEIVGRQEQEFI